MTDLAAKFLADVEDLRHHERVKRAVRLGQEASAGDKAAQATVSSLHTSESTYARTIALWTTFGSRDPRLVQASLRDRSRSIRGRARGLLWMLDDDQVVETLASVSFGSSLGDVLIRLRKTKRQSCIDRWQSQLWRSDSAARESLDFLGYTSPALVKSLLDGPDGPARYDRLGVAGWRRLATFHPTWVCGYLDDELNRDLNPRLQWRLRVLLTPLAAYGPAAVIGLVTRILMTDTRPKQWLQRPMQELTRRHPVAVFDALRALRETSRPVPSPGALGAVAFDKVVAQLGQERVLYLVAHACTTLKDGDKGRGWFLSLDEEQRHAVVERWLETGHAAWGAFLLRYIKPAQQARALRAYERWSVQARNSDGVIPVARLAPLPRALRLREAHRHLEDVPYLRTRNAERFAYARYLEFDDAKTVMLSWLKHPEAAERVKAITPLILTAAHALSGLAPVLPYVIARRFEQDPVRLVMLSSLASLPRRCFSAADLPALSEIFQHAVDAADLSFATGSAMERLLVKLFDLDSDWCSSWLVKLLEIRGQLSTYGLLQHAPKSQLLALDPALKKLVDLWSTRERFPALTWLALSLGPRLRDLPSVLTALETLMRESKFFVVANVAALQLARANGRRFAAAADALLSKDLTNLVLANVGTHLATQRQDLLAPVLAGTLGPGRFKREFKTWTVHFERGHATWTRQLQCQHADGLVRLLTAKKQHVGGLRYALLELTRMAYIPADYVTRFAEDVRPPMREIAVRSLGRIDDGSGFEVMVQCLADDRARWAIYAIRARLREMPTKEAAAALADMPMNKVTVAKEVVRLLGELGGDEGYRQLLEMDRSAMHRDVRIALLRGLWDHLDQPEAWTVWREAAADPDWVVASRLVDLPTGILGSQAEAKMAELFAELLGRPELDARLSLLRRAPHLPIADQKRSFFNALVERIDAPDVEEANVALGAVLVRLRVGEDRSVAQAIVRSRRFPRVMRALLETLKAHSGPYASTGVIQVAQRVFDTLRQDPQLVPESIALAPALHKTVEIAQLLRNISAQGWLHHDAMTASLSVARLPFAAKLERALRGENDPQLRRVALEALKTASQFGKGWQPKQKQALLAYQADGSPLVSGAALWVVPA